MKFQNYKTPFAFRANFPQTSFDQRFQIISQCVYFFKEDAPTNTQGPISYLSRINLYNIPLQ